jgi:hypothetical protein
VYNYHDSRACGYREFGIFPRIDVFGMVLVWLWFGYGIGSKYFLV